MKVLCTVLKPELLLQLNLFTIGVLLCLQWRILAVAYLLNVKILAANSDKCKHFCSGHKLYIREQEGLKRVLYIFGSLSCVLIRSTSHLPASTCYKSMSMFSRHIRFCSIQARRSLHSSSASDRRRISFGSGCRLFHRRNRPPPYISYLKLPSHHCFVLSPSAHLMDQL